ncbi:hypothetical protein ATANTOWER_011365, partial [Ataeniobius toweri]|nr:hypothetical protein [Ataeniobius toweri]
TVLRRTDRRTHALQFPGLAPQPAPLLCRRIPTARSRQLHKVCCMPILHAGQRSIWPQKYIKPPIRLGSSKAISEKPIDTTTLHILQVCL